MVKKLPESILKNKDVQNKVLPDPELCITPEKDTNIAKKNNNSSELETDSSLELTPEKENVFVRPTKCKKHVCFDISTEKSHTLSHEIEPAKNSNIESNTLTSCYHNEINDKKHKVRSIYEENTEINFGAEKLQTNKLSAQKKINEMTRPKNSSRINNINSSNLNEHFVKKHNFLRKKQGLSRFSHSTNKGENNFNDLELGDFKYNSSLVQGFHLQVLKEDKFDALETAIKQVENDKQLQREVMKSASNATNIAAEEKVYTNLKSVHDNEYLNIMNNYTPKNCNLVKSDNKAGPDINSFPVDDLMNEIVLIADSTYVGSKLKPQLSDISSALDLYKRQCCHNEFDII